jgi:structural maintenance of chromosome 3 (chondroitin sulfate proteoglycan 6)
VVVDSDETVSRILALMHKKKIPGRISFMPLNRLHVEDHKYPESTVCVP